MGLAPPLLDGDLGRARFEHALRLGDDALVLVQRLGESSPRPTGENVVLSYDT